MTPETSWRDRGRLGWKADAFQDFGGDFGFLDRGDHTYRSAATSFTYRNVNIEHAAQQRDQE